MIIVTGGAGFIGSNIVKGLNERGREDVLIVDNLTTWIRTISLLLSKMANLMMPILK